MLKRTLCVILVIILLSPVVYAQGRPSVSAKGAVLMEAGSGEVLYAVNPDAKLPMASTTKIMTALLVLEKAEEENIHVTVTKEMVAVEGTSMGLLPGDIISLTELAAGMLLASGNDAANTGAIAMAGSLDKFAELMNEKAQELGMKNSHFVTPSGLDADEHYSTARDMAILTRAALNNEKFREIAALKSKRVELDNNRVLSVSNHNKLLSRYEGCTGVKTGFTKKSGRCLVSSAVRNGVTMIAVTLSASDDWNAHESMLDYGFSQMMSHNGTAEMSATYTLPIVGGMMDTVAVRPTKFDGAILKKGSDSEFEYCIHLPRFLYAPVMKNQVVGEIVCLLDGQEVGRLDLLTVEDCPYVETEKKPGFFERLFGIFTSETEKSGGT